MRRGFGELELSGPPLVNFGVAIAERKAAGIVMAGGGIIDPARSAGGDSEGTVVNAEGVFVHEQEDITASDPAKIRCLAEGRVRIVMLIDSMRAGQPWTVGGTVRLSAVG